ncbi:mechanosensitive ion channel [Mycobacterium sp. Y57]|uniref:mechanosensitive ion channel domain-containing protein n=1 Tax=Mycolicibacterium xanthum TaxID=2796469 RepID=UPI001C844F7F|nr:mechanosensitive ion channel family protein [Mycolicibacterium xanthum]MBX7431356.1 mechanosensitive ion channel [Mycolicibacterium xanthum]
MSVFASPWFYWAVGIAIGLPVGLIILTEWQQALRRKGSSLARPVTLLRNWVLPIGAIALLMVQVGEIPAEATPTKLIGTLLAFVVLVLLLSGVNATLFQNAPQGTWRRRVPAIFVDVARLVLIAIGLAFVFSNIWGADIQGLFTALGVTSIVIGLMLQNSVGQVISGLLVLFEQPFEIGDWLETPTARGAVVEVNWRSVHLETADGLQITPNSVLAESSFTNLSRPQGKHRLRMTSVFTIDDRPDQVCEMLSRVAADLPQRDPNSTPYAIPLGGLEYRTSIRLRTAADYSVARSTFLRWIWYASRRDGLHLDEAEDILPLPEELADAVQQVIAPTLQLTPDGQAALMEHCRLERYGAGELVLRAGEVPERMTFIVSGQVQLTVTDGTGADLPVGMVTEGSFVGQNTLTRQPVTGCARAVDELTVVHVNRAYIERLVDENPLLLEDFGRIIEDRRAAALQLLATKTR